MSELKQAQIAKRHLSERYLLKSRAVASAARPSGGVVAIGAGYRIVDDKRIDEPCVRVYAEPKTIESLRRRLPETTEGVPVDLMPSDTFRPLRVRPARPGCSIGFRDDSVDDSMAGTFGAIVEREGTLFILSNNHVLADENRLHPGASIVQPGRLDDRNAEVIARLSKFVELRTTEPNQHDCAIAEVLDRSFVDPAFPTPIEALPSARATFPIEGASVEKIGRTTLYTKGEVFDVDFDVEVHYARLGRLVFQGQLAIRGSGGMFAEPGDSGALVIDGESRQPVGLLFAGSPQFTVISPLSPVLEALDVRLVI